MKIQVGNDQKMAQSEINSRDKKMQTDCKYSLRIGNIRALNGCTGRLVRADTRHNHKHYDIKKIHVDNDQEMAQSERNSTFKTFLQIGAPSDNLLFVRYLLFW